MQAKDVRNGVESLPTFEQNLDKIGTMRTKNIEVTHNPEKQRFELTVDEHLGRLDYTLTGKIIIFLHTEVPPAIGGRGLGVSLVEAGLAYAKENGLKVRSMCWFVSKYLRRRPEYQDLMK